ncbi:2-amino-4-hydroxy-6-hydroxymethyldihydropteridine diphosphokinase [Algoriphagus mannitolivorans]|uniref:2-amino-4-hydroxy-6- hydroxymethyldihydropteridine diphosphokinase n=1 Tax=Algoriphagus mannitolivorans TaxID=226504 RepID=UPI0003FA7796|nr:2-amino-4-hydroxy-6-hydroxymethyldihydropteridine diphosphokinase [Algoriphagus mannitolivorans]
MQNEVVLCLGGNQGDREKLLFRAIEALNDHFQLIRVSKIYESEAWGGVAQGNFLNQVALISTQFSAQDVLEIIQQIEHDLGRKREDHWGNRTMDIDILYFGNEIISTQNLKIPHPFIAERRFVLAPLADILPDFKNPITGKTSLEMLQECQDDSLVVLYKK